MGEGSNPPYEAVGSGSGGSITCGFVICIERVQLQRALKFCLQRPLPVLAIFRPDKEMGMRNAMLMTLVLASGSGCAQGPLDGRTTDLRDSTATYAELQKDLELRENIVLSCKTFGTERLNRDKPACINAFKAKREEATAEIYAELQATRDRLEAARTKAKEF